MPSQRNEIKDIKRKLLRSNCESLYVYETMQQTGVNHSLINGTMTANISQGGSTPVSSALLWIDEPHFSKIIRYVIYCLLFVFAIGGNATVCIIPFRHRRMRTCTYFLITNLADVVRIVVEGKFFLGHLTCLLRTVGMYLKSDMASN